MIRAGAGVARWSINVFVGGFLALQLLLPLPALLRDQTETRGILSWNMYAERYRCTARYSAVTSDGTRIPLTVSRYFNNPDRAGLVRHRDVLPRFHAWLCEDAGAGEAPIALQGSVACSANGGPEVQLVRQEVDLCTAPEFGVEAVPRPLVSGSSR